MNSVSTGCTPFNIALGSTASVQPSGFAIAFLYVARKHSERDRLTLERVRMNNKAQLQGNSIRKLQNGYTSAGGSSSTPSTAKSRSSDLLYSNAAVLLGHEYARSAKPDGLQVESGLCEFVIPFADVSNEWVSSTETEARRTGTPQRVVSVARPSSGAANQECQRLEKLFDRVFKTRCILIPR